MIVGFYMYTLKGTLEKVAGLFSAEPSGTAYDLLNDMDYEKSSPSVTKALFEAIDELGARQSGDYPSSFDELFLLNQKRKKTGIKDVSKLRYLVRGSTPGPLKEDTVFKRVVKGVNALSNEYATNNKHKQNIVEKYLTTSPKKVPKSIKPTKQDALKLKNEISKIKNKHFVTFPDIFNELNTSQKALLGALVGGLGVYGVHKVYSWLFGENATRGFEKRSGDSSTEPASLSKLKAFGGDVADIATNASNYFNTKDTKYAVKAQESIKKFYKKCPWGGSVASTMPALNKLLNTNIPSTTSSQNILDTDPDVLLEQAIERRRKGGDASIPSSVSNSFSVEDLNKMLKDKKATNYNPILLGLLLGAGVYGGYSLYKWLRDKNKHEEIRPSNRYFRRYR